MSAAAGAESGRARSAGPALSLRTALACLLLLGGAALVSAQAASPSVSPSSDEGPEEEIAQVTAPVVLDGETLFRLRGARSYSAAERARAISGRIEEFARAASEAPEVAAEPADGVLRLVAGDRFLMAITGVDAALEGVDGRALAVLYSDRIAKAVRAYREARTPAALLRGAQRSAAATGLLAVSLLVLAWVSRRLNARLRRGYEERLRSLQFQSFEIVKAQRLRDALRWLLHALQAAAAAVLLYFWLEFVLGSFRATQPLARRLLALVLEPLRQMGGAFVEQLPNLAFLLVLFLVVRWLLRLARLFFEAVEKGHVTLSGFEPEWAVPTFRVLRLLVVAFALVVAYPYIPGSDSAAFQGLSLLLGVMLSIGSSSFISNIIAGYSMIYRRAFRVGDRIRVGDVLGDVTAIRLQVTHVRSVKNEEVSLPNSLLLASYVVNYTTLARSHGLILHTTVGIGYETPWRQVEAMLLESAARTEGLLREPPPFVLQTNLGDFCVTYELNVHCDAPSRMATLYSELHRSILDVFNEYGVQIMTPAYETDTAVPKVVPREQWYAAPARAPESPTVAGARSTE